MSRSPNDRRIRGAISGLTTSQEHQLLADERRRTALHILSNRATPVTLGDLASDVAAHEAESDWGENPTVRSVALSLHHRHLPKMDELGVVDYDWTNNSIEWVAQPDGI